MAAQDLALGRVGSEFPGNGANRHACRTIHATGAISDRLGAAESDAAERFIKLPGIAAVQFREHLPLNLARKIGARAGVGDKELREAKRCAHPDLPSANGYETLYARRKRVRKGGVTPKRGLMR